MAACLAMSGRLTRGATSVPLPATCGRLQGCFDIVVEADAPYEPCAARVWELRGNVTAYDGWYAAVAECSTLGQLSEVTSWRMPHRAYSRREGISFRRDSSSFSRSGPPILRSANLFCRIFADAHMTRRVINVSSAAAQSPLPGRPCTARPRLASRC
jgi:hypothetical protein